MFHTNLVRYMRIKEKTTKDFTQNSDPTLNIPRSTFYYILKGENTPSPENARKIAKVLGIKAETLFKHDDREEVTPSTQDEIEQYKQQIVTIRGQRDAALNGWTEANALNRKITNTVGGFLAIFFAMGMCVGGLTLMFVVGLVS